MNFFFGGTVSALAMLEYLIMIISIQIIQKDNNNQSRTS